MVVTMQGKPCKNVFYKLNKNNLVIIKNYRTFAPIFQNRFKEEGL